MKKKGPKSTSIKSVERGEYDDMLTGVVDLLESARRTAARSVNTLMTATYWEIGRRIVEHEQAGETRAEYGEEVLKRLAGASRIVLVAVSRAAMSNRCDRSTLPSRRTRFGRQCLPNLKVRHSE